MSHLSVFRNVLGAGGSELRRLGGSELRRDEIIREDRDARGPKETLSFLRQFSEIEVIRFLDNNKILD